MAIVILVIWLGIAGLYRCRPKVAAALYLLVLPTFPFYWAPFSANPWNDVTIQHLVAGGIAVGLALEVADTLLQGASVSRTFTRELALLGILLAWSVSSLSNISHTGTVRNLWWSLCDLYVPFALACRLARSAEGVAFIARWVRWPAVGVVIVTIVEYVQQTPVTFNYFNSLRSSATDLTWLPAERADLLRVQATLGQSIFLAFYLVMAAVLFFVAALRATSVRARTVNASLALSLAIVSFLPLARGAMLGLILVAALFGVFLGYRARIVLLISLLGLSMFLFAAADTLATSNNFMAGFALTLIGRASGGVASDQLQNYYVRTDVVSTGIDLIANGPAFGYGTLSVNTGGSPIPDVANVFIQVGLLSGIVGLVLFVLFLFVVGRDLLILWKLRRRGPDGVYVYGLTALGALTLLCFSDSSWPGQYTQFALIFFGTISAWSSGVSESISQFVNLVRPPAHRGYHAPIRKHRVTDPG